MFNAFPMRITLCCFVFCGMCFYGSAGRKQATVYLQKDAEIMKHRFKISQEAPGLFKPEPGQPTTPEEVQQLFDKVHQAEATSRVLYNAGIVLGSLGSLLMVLGIGKMCLLGVLIPQSPTTPVSKRSALTQEAARAQGGHPQNRSFQHSNHSERP